MSKTFTALTHLLSFVWILVISLAGFTHHPLHPKVAFLSALPVFLLQYVWVKKAAQSGLYNREAILRHYLLLLGILLAWATGVAMAIGFVPFVFHQVIVWAFVPFFAWRTSRLLLTWIFGH